MGNVQVTRYTHERVELEVYLVNELGEVSKQPLQELNHGNRSINDSATAERRRTKR